MAFTRDILAAAAQAAVTRGLYIGCGNGRNYLPRVNATATDVWPRHEVTERDHDGGLTVRYLTGPKQGLHIHFFASTELDELFANYFTPILPLRVQQTRRDPPQPGQWSQWEAIWRRR